LLWPVSLLFWLISTVRRHVYRLGLRPVYRASVPVIVVGNITVGGSGKTPLILALVEALRQAGFTPGVVSRGYGGDTTYPARVDNHSSPAAVGDEPLLIALRTGAPVVVDPIRAQAVRYLLQNQLCDVILADDGLQHYPLARDIEICVVDARRGFGNARLLPMGPLREPYRRLYSVDYIVVHGGAGNIYPGEVPMSLQADAWQNLRPGSARMPPAPGSRIHAVAGIGHPPRFFAMLREQGFDVVEHAFADHHAYTAADLAFGDGLAVVMTEKDAVKCRGLVGDNTWYVPVTAVLPPVFFETLVEDLRRLRLRTH
jgi:tetraacyldisaccharide 4'-kinase